MNAESSSCGSQPGWHCGAVFAPYGYYYIRAAECESSDCLRHRANGELATWACYAFDTSEGGQSIWEIHSDHAKNLLSQQCLYFNADTTFTGDTLPITDCDTTGTYLLPWYSLMKYTLPESNDHACQHQNISFEGSLASKLSNTPKMIFISHLQPLQISNKAKFHAFFEKFSH